MTIEDPDFVFLTEALPQLQAYLLSNELYWPLSASFPRLTPGAVLLTMARLHARLPSESQKLQQQLDSILLKWRTAWEKKAAREISNRLRLWTTFLSDYASAPEQNADAYLGEVRGRVILQLLMQVVQDFPEAQALAEADSLVKARLRPSEFLWDANLQAVFPKADFWFLYGRL